MKEILKPFTGITLIFLAILLPQINTSLISFSDIDRVVLLGLQISLTLIGLMTVYLDE